MTDRNITVVVGAYAEQWAPVVARDAGARSILDIRDCERLAGRQFGFVAEVPIVVVVGQRKSPFARIMGRMAARIVAANKRENANVVKGADRGKVFNVEKETQCATR